MRTLRRSTQGPGLRRIVSPGSGNNYVLSCIHTTINYPSIQLTWQHVWVCVISVQPEVCCPGMALTEEQINSLINWYQTGGSFNGPVFRLLMKEGPVMFTQLSCDCQTVFIAADSVCVCVFSHQCQRACDQFSSSCSSWAADSFLWDSLRGINDVYSEPRS